jgi:hypothetical protein
MRASLHRLRTNVRTRQYALAVAVLGGAVVVAVTGSWVFRASPRQPNASLWELVLSDRWTLGFVRVAVFLLALYAIASIAALVAGGRWIKGFGAGGLSADDAVETDKWVAETQRELERARQSHDLVAEVLLRRSGE